MKAILFSIALSACTLNVFAQNQAATTTPAEITSLKIGASIPLSGEVLKTTDGNAISLEKAKTEGGLLVMFSCNTCPFVVKSQQRTLEAMRMAKDLGVGMVVINSNQAQRGDVDSYEAMAEYAKNQGYQMPYALDEQSRLANAFGATRTPEVFLFNAKGVLVYKGAMEDNPSDPASSKKLYLANALKQLKSGGKINPAETKSIGCSIKRES